METKEQIVNRLKEKYRKICLLLPVYKYVESKSHTCMVVFLADLYKAGFEPHVTFVDNTYLLYSRTLLSEAFIQNHKWGNFDLAMWIDADNFFNFWDFLKLLYDYDTLRARGNSVDILSARYLTRTPSDVQIVGYVNKGSKEIPQYFPISKETKGVAKVDAVGFGFLIMNSEVMLNMYKTYGKRQFAFREFGDKENWNVLGEDVSWCEKARELGYNIFLDNNVEIGHIGGIINSDYKGAEFHNFEIFD